MNRWYWSLGMHAGRFLSSFPRHYCCSNLGVKPIFHVEAGPWQALLRGITGMGWHRTYLTGILSKHPCRELGFKAGGRICCEFLSWRKYELTDLWWGVSWCLIVEYPIFLTWTAQNIYNTLLCFTTHIKNLISMDCDQCFLTVPIVMPAAVELSK